MAPSEMILHNSSMCPAESILYNDKQHVMHNYEGNVPRAYCISVVVPYKIYAIYK